MLIRRLLAIVSVLALLVAALPSDALAQDEPDGVPLTLDQCLRAALKNNLDLVSASYTPALREQQVVTEESGFDPTFNVDVSRNDSRQAATQTSTVAGSTRDAANLSLSQTTKVGVDVSAGFGSSKSEQIGLNVISPTSYFSGFSFDVTVPLLKGFGNRVNTEAIVLARNDHDISVHDLERQAEVTLQTVEGAYWDVLAAWAELNVARQSLQRAQDLLDLNRKKVDVGTLAPIEITQAEAGVASQEEGVILAEVRLQDTQDELRRLIAIPKNDPLWNQEINPVDRPTFEKFEVDVEAAIETALIERQEMYNAEVTVRNRELNERVAHRLVRHQLDFVGNWSPRGASLDQINPLTRAETNNATLGESIDDIWNGDQYQWTAQIVYRLPIANRAAKANYARAKITRRQSEVDLQNQEQTIRVEVRQAARAVDSGIKRVEAAQTNVRLQREKLEAEQKKFENGMSTSFEVLTFQNDLATAELREIQARLDYVKALAALERSKGTLLESRGLHMETPGDVDG